MKTVVVYGAFDDPRSAQLRFLQEAARLGAVHALLWSDEMAELVQGRAPQFPLAERRYLVEAIRCVSRVDVVSQPGDPDALPLGPDLQPDIWAMRDGEETPARRAFCATHGITGVTFGAAALAGFPEMQDVVSPDTPAPASGVGAALSQPGAPGPRPSVVVTGCYDWFHSGHIRFFEEVSQLGDLYVIVGHDANVRELKGEGHPLFPAEERRYMVGAIRYVRQAFISTGYGWMDAAPEIVRLKPDLYAVNEDGDKPEKRAFCREHGLEYVVLKRTPKAGLPPRTSSKLRGF